MINTSQKSGSSLILVLLIIAGILTVVFGSQRVTLVQFSQSNREEDNVSAYYAARAGIEDGLLRYRFTRNAQTADGKVYRYNLTGGDPLGLSPSYEVPGSGLIESVAGYKPTNQYYDLSMDFKTDKIHMEVLNPIPTPKLNGTPVLAKDSVLELTGFGDYFPSSYYLRHAFKFLDGNGNECSNSNAFVQIERRGRSGEFTQFQVKKPNGSHIDSVNVGGNIQIDVADTTSSIRIRPYHCGVQYAFNTSTNSNSAGPAGPKFDSLTANITAVGYYGSAKRTLLATVDRNTGRLIDIYDFNALAGNDVKP